MKIPQIVLASAAFFLALITASHAQREAQKQGHSAPLNTATGAIMEGYSLTIATDQQTYTAGGSIIATVTFKNVSHKSEYVSTDPYLKYRFKIQSPDGEQAPVTAYGKRYFGPDRKIVIGLSGRYMKAGEEVTICYPLNRIYDMTLAGNYTISASTFVIKPNARQSSKFKAGDAPEILDSGLLTVTIGDEKDEERFYQPAFQEAASAETQMSRIGTSNRRNVP